MKFDTLSDDQLPEWLKHYPKEYSYLIEQNLVMFRPWYLLNEQLTTLRNSGLKDRFPSHNLFAFAARLDNDDIACWGEGSLGKVIVVHDFSEEQFANRREFENFWDWFRAAIEEMIDFEK
jgi:hypothetical protein